MKSISDEELGCPDPAVGENDLSEKEIESKLEELLNSFRPEDRKNVLKFCELVGKLGPEKKTILEKLSTGYHSPSIKT